MDKCFYKKKKQFKSEKNFNQTKIIMIENNQKLKKKPRLPFSEAAFLSQRHLFSLFILKTG